jgi:hypothetical protein
MRILTIVLLILMFSVAGLSQGSLRELQEQKAAAEQELSNLRVKFTDEMPEVQKQIHSIKLLNQLIEQKLAKPSPKRWKGMEIDVTKAEQIIEKFGKPNKDEKSKVFVIGGGKEYSPELGKKGFRVLKYNAIEQAKDVALVVDAENVLVLIQFEPEKGIEVQAFLNAYEQIDFQPVTNTLFGSDSSVVYSLLGNEDSTNVAAVVQQGFGTQLGLVPRRVNVNKIEQSNKTLTGKVKMIQLISDRLKNTTNTDVLK